MIDRILKLPAWKAFILAVALVFFIGVGIETILMHTVFGFFDHLMTKFEKEKSEDIEDMEEMDRESKKRDKEFKRSWEAGEKDLKASSARIDKQAHDDQLSYFCGQYTAANLTMQSCQKQIADIKKQAKLKDDGIPIDIKMISCNGQIHRAKDTLDSLSKSK